MRTADLSEEGDWLLTHGVCIADVGLDDLSKRLLHSLQTEDNNNEVKRGHRLQREQLG